MAEITWRNVNQRDNNGAIALMSAAQGSINAGLNSFGGIIKDRQQINAGNFAVGQDALKQSLMDQVNSFGSVDDYAAAQQSGQIDQLLSGIANPAMRREVQAAADARMSTLRDQEVADRNFTQGRADALARPIYEELMAGINNDTFNSIDALPPEQREALINSGQFNNVVETLNRVNRGEVTQKREDDENARTEATRAATDSLNNIVRTSLDQVTQSEKDREAAYLDLAVNKFRLPMKESGVPDFEAVHPSLVAAFNERVHAAGLDQGVSRSQALRNIEEQFRTNPEFADQDPNMLFSALDTADQALSMGDRFAAADQAAINSELASAAETLGMNNNALYLEQGYNPSAVASEAIIDIMAVNPEIAEYFDNQSRKNSFVREVEKALSGDGVKIGNGKYVKLVPSDMKNILLSFGKDWMEITDKNIDVLIKDYAKQEHIQQRQADFTEYKQFESSATARAESRYGNTKRFDDVISVTSRAGKAALQKLLQPPSG